MTFRIELWFFKRIFSSLVIVWGASTLVFFLLRVLPGDPAALLLGDFFSETEVLALSKDLNLHLSLIKQYELYFVELLSGNLGESFIRQEKVGDLLREYFPNTVFLSLSIFFSALFCSLLFCFCWLRARSRWANMCFSIASMALMCAPVFVLAPYAIKIFSVNLGWLPVGGSGSWEHLVLPGLCSGLLSSGVMSRTLHRKLSEEFSKEYIRTAKAKGLSFFQIFWRHALKNSANSFITLCSFVFINLLTGSLIVEIIFDYPGVGRLLYEAYMTRDLPLIQGLVVFLSFIYIGVHLMNDLAYSIFDPRVKHT